MGKKLERLIQHITAEHSDKGLAPERTTKLAEAFAGRVARVKTTPPVLDDHDTRGVDGVQP